MDATRRLPFLLVLMAVTAGASPSGAEEARPPGSSQNLSRLALLDLRGDLVPIRYSAGSLQRASRIQEPFELLASDFARWSGRKDRLPVLLLSRDEWERAGLGLPYGMASRALGSGVALAAWGDAQTVDFWGGLLGWELPSVDEPPMRSSADEAASLVATDFLGLFEGARILLEKAGMGGRESWISDVFAHTAAATVIARIPASGVSQAENLYRLLGRSKTAGPLPLSAYRAGLSLEDWLWFQSKFFSAALVILEEDRRNAGKALAKLARKNGGLISRGALIRQYPDLDPWFQQAFAAESD